MVIRRKKGGRGKGRRTTKRDPYNIPDEQDLELLRGDLEGFQKKLDEEGRLLPKHAGTMLRSAIRQVWMRAPNKLAFLLERQVPDTDPNNRRLWKYQCEMCGEWFGKKEVEVDHKKGNHSLITPEDFPEYYEKILNAPHSALQLLCIHCHEFKTYAERYDLTLEEAKMEKEVVKFKKLKAGEQSTLLKELGLPKGNNADKRVNIYRGWVHSKGGIT